MLILTTTPEIRLLRASSLRALVLTVGAIAVACGSSDDGVSQFDAGSDAGGGVTDSGISSGDGSNGFITTDSGTSCPSQVLCGAGKLVSDTLIGRELYGSNDVNYGPGSVIAVGGVGYIRVQNATDGTIIGAALQVPGTGRGGPPTIADFDGDGDMEIASANGNKYSVFEFDKTTKALSAKWSHDTQDLSSNVTGSSVFDFEGDGAAEVVYNDECYSRVFKGSDGTVLLQIPNSTATTHEYPVIADVNGDNHTEYVVVANDVNHLNHTVTCPADDAGAYVPRHGIFVYGGPANMWVKTRRVWNVIACRRKAKVCSTRRTSLSISRSRPCLARAVCNCAHA